MKRLKKRVGVVLLALLLLMLFPGMEFVHAATPSMEREDVAAFLTDVIEREMEIHHIPNLSVALVQEGEVLFAEGFGFADRAADTPVDPEKTLFRIGSSSKLFTWTAVMQLVEQGKIDLDTDINEYLDFQIPYRLEHRWRRSEAGPITLRHLMSHTPGFEDYMTDVFSISEDSLQPLGQKMRENRPNRVFLPGEVTAYSNYGVSLAGYIVERVSGLPFEEYVEAHIYRPLGMTHSTFRQPLPDPLADQLAKPYRYVEGEYREADFEFFTAPAGSMSSTAADMARFMKAYLQGGKGEAGSMLQEETIRLMLSEPSTQHPQLPGMAHGFIKADFNGQEVFHHPGSTMLYDTSLYLIPEAQTGFFITHSGGSALMNANIYRQFMNRYFPREPETAYERPEGMVQRSAAFTGEYYQNRRSFTDPDAALSMMFGRMRVETDNEGYLLVTQMGSTSRFVEVEPGVYRNLEAGVIQEYGGDFNTIVFGTDSLGKTMLMSSGPMSYSRAAWYESMGLTLILLLTSLLVILGSMLFWGMRWVIRLVRKSRNKSEVSPALPKGARWANRAAILLGLLVLVFFMGVLLGGELDPVYQLPIQAYTAPSQLNVIMDATIPYAIILLSAAILAMAAMSWKKGYWKTAGRIHYTFFAFTSVVLSWLLVFWNIA